MSRTLLSLAGFQVIISGRFWVIAEVERIMTAFKSYRVTHEYTQTNPAAPEKVFPLLCPVREGDCFPAGNIA